MQFGSVEPEELNSIDFSLPKEPCNKQNDFTRQEK